MAMRRAGKLGFVSKHPIICQSEKPGESLDGNPDGLFMSIQR